MNAIRSILAASDFSDDADNALARAARIASEQDSKLALLHIISKPSLAALRALVVKPDMEANLVTATSRELNQEAARLAAAHGVDVTTKVQIGEINAEILDAVRQADLLVVGARGANPVRDFLLGSTAERLLATCPHPVLVVKRPPQHTYSRVLVPVDFSRSSASALSLAMQIAPQAEITVFHAFDVPFEGKLRLAGVAEDRINEYRIQARAQALKGIDAMLANTGSSAIRPLHTVDRGDAPRLILAHEQHTQPDLIVMGRQGHSAMEQFLLGSVTRHILAGAGCDVLVDTREPGSVQA